MNSLLILLLLLSFVFLLMIFPVKKRRIQFDEKGEAIKVYQEEVGHINRQADKGFIDEATKTQLLAELDKKTALAITAIEKKTFAYQRSFVPLVLIVLGLVIASTIYYRHYQQSGVMRWQAFNEKFQGQITEGLFDDEVVAEFLAKRDVKISSAYCFAMQHELLAKYDTNPDALGNLANCFLTVGYPELAEQAIERGLNSKPNHTELNYLTAELQYAKNNYLSQASVENLLKVVKQDPNHFKSIRLLAMNSLNQGSYGQAKFFFSQLKQLAPQDNKQLVSALDKLLAEIDAKLSETGQVDKVNQLPNDGTHQPAVTNESSKPVTELTDKSVSIKANIVITPELTKSLTGEQVLFLVVKDAQGKLLNATKHLITNKNQPLNVTVTDNTQGMMKMGEMAGNKKVSLVARVSLSGSPMASSGDLTSDSVTVILPQDKTANLVINQKVP